MPLDWSKRASSAGLRRPLQASRRRVAVIAALVTSDYLATALAIATGEILLPSSSWAWPEAAFALFAVLLPLHAYLGLYSCWGSCPIERLRLRALSALGLGAVTFIALPAWHAPVDIAALGMVAALLFVVGHYLESLARLALMRAGLWGASTILIGSPDKCAQMGRMLLAHPKLGLKPIGIVTDQAEDARSETTLPLLCGLTEAHRLTGLAEVAIVAASDLSESDMTEALRLSRLPFPHVIVAESGGGIPNLGLHSRNLGAAAGLELRFNLFRRGNLLLKRLIDLAIALPVALAAAPLVIILAAAVKIADPGPAFYRQRRVGRDGSVLDVLKLRTMYGNAEERLREHLQSDPRAAAEWARFFKLSDDPRVLPGIGNVLRRSSLDELPQLWNILRGEMSIVGPRPFPAYHMSGFDPDFQVLRVSVPPGLTGLWQVSSRSGGDLAVQKEQDLFYIRNWSIWLDLYILLETVPAVLTARGAK
ncbi:exopolysaccharide biosynthesis polyprenyl glycosylphosphotransferase [Bosea caraganae]|uniref:exopolysaccharide biosynthesis polyprenyl glycosylphosphotransferase n=1 Tax=Bosea caraganae TaxID=2763117 RepID=UPI0015F03D66|nr:exopolysaccharide biosynthesis polyprenyl glycosylphosphotransferase [Bosea caraganae]